MRAGDKFKMRVAHIYDAILVHEYSSGMKYIASVDPSLSSGLVNTRTYQASCSISFSMFPRRLKSVRYTLIHAEVRCFDPAAIDAINSRRGSRDLALSIGL